MKAFSQLTRWKAFPQLPRWKVRLSVFFCSAFIVLPFVFFGRFALALPTVMSAVVLAIIVLMKWELKGQAWFWAVICTVVALHVVVQYLFRGTRRGFPV